MIRWALRYAARGFPVLPLEPHGKAPLARLVRHGVRQATTDPAVISEWWQREPRANIGIRCSGLLVIDIDPRNSGDATWARLLGNRDPLVNVPTVATGGNGWHWYFKPPGFPVVSHLGLGVDIQFGARYVVAPPSIHPNGRVYRWVTPPSAGLASLPPWLAGELYAMPVADNREEPLPAPRAPVASSRPRRPGDRLPPLDVIERARRYLAKCEPAVSGQRGAFVTMRVCAALVRGFELTEEEALPLLLEWDRDNDPPWGEAEIKRKLGGVGSAPDVTSAGGRPPIRRGALLAG